MVAETAERTLIKLDHQQANTSNTREKKPVHNANAVVYARAHGAGCCMYAGYRLHWKALMLLFAIEYQAVPRWNFLRCNNRL